VQHFKRILSGKELMSLLAVLEISHKVELLVFECKTNKNILKKKEKQ